MDNKKQSSSVFIPIVRPSPEPPDRVVIPTTPLSAPYFPYDPGPASFPPLTNVSYPHYSFQFQFEYEELPANPSQRDKEIVPQTITMLIKKSTHEAGVVARVFHLPIPVCSIDVLFGYDIRTSVAYTNIEISSEAHYVFVKMPLKTNFSCGTLKSLVCGIQIHASFVHAEIAMSDTLELVMFLLNAKLGMVAFDCQFMELRMVWLIIIDVGSTYSDLVLRHLVDECSWLSKSRYMLYVYLHFVDVERLVQNSLGRFTVPESDQSHGYNLCTLMLLATILATCSTHPFSHHVLEAAANCVLERRKLNYISSDILINMFLGDGSLVAALMVKVVNEKVLYEYPANSALEIHLPQCTRNCLDMYWYSHLIFAAETISVAFLHYEKSSPILCYDIKSSCILAKDDLSAIIASMGLLYCVVTSNLQWYLNCQCLHFCKTSISNMHVAVLLGILHPVPISQFHYSEPSFGPCGYYNLDGRCYGVPQIVLNSMKIRQEVSDIYGIEISHWWPKTTKQSILQTITILSNHSMKWDTNGNGCFFYNKGSLQFQQWDPGGCSLLHGEGPLDLEATQKDTIITQQHCANFNLEDKVDFNGGSNVMIENGI